MKTKIYLVLASLFLFVGSLSAQVDVDNDTTKIVIKGKKILIIDDDDSSKVIIDGKEFGDDNKKSKKTDDLSYFKGVYLGVAGLRNPKGALSLGPSQIELNYARSFNMQANLFEKSIPLIKEYVKITTGIGYNFNSYQIENNIDLIKGPDEILEIENVGVNYEKNKLRVGYLTVPLMIGLSSTQMQEKGFKITAGIQGGYRVQGNIKKKYEQGGETFKPKYRSDLYLNDFTYSAIARFSFDNIMLYAEYGLQPLFKTGRAAEIYPFSIGIRLVDFN